MTTRDNIIYYTITAFVFVGIVVCSLLFHNPGQPTNGDSERENISAIVAAVSPFLTAAATIVLVGITWRYVRLTQDILKATNKPEVILFLRYSDYFINLCVQNIGAGYASDVEFGEDLSFKTVQYGQEDKVLKDIEPFKSGINFLGNGHKIDTVLCDSRDVHDLEKRSFNILVSYKDSAGKTFKQLFPFDLGNWEDTSQYLSPHTDDVANAIEKVAGQLERMANRR